MSLSLKLAVMEAYGVDDSAATTRANRITAVMDWLKARHGSAGGASTTLTTLLATEIAAQGFGGYAEADALTDLAFIKAHSWFAVAHATGAATT